MPGRNSKQKSINKTFGERLNQRMRELKISNSKLGEKLGVSAAAVSGYRNGNREPDINALIQIARNLNTSIDYLTGKEDDTSPDFSILEMAKYTGLSSASIEELHAWNSDDYPYVDSKKWIDLLAKMIETNVDHTDFSGMDWSDFVRIGKDPFYTPMYFALLSSMYDYAVGENDTLDLVVYEQDPDDPTVLRPKSIGSYQSGTVFLSGKDGIKAITKDSLEREAFDSFCEKVKSLAKYYRMKNAKEEL